MISRPILSSEAHQKINRILMTVVEEGRIPAVAFAATNIDGLICSAGVGAPDNTVPSRTVDDASVFWICSQTKLVVSIAILQLIEKGLVCYDTLVSEVLLELSHPVVLDDPTSLHSVFRPAKNPIKILNLLNHSSGIFPESPQDNSDALPTPYRMKYESGDAAASFINAIKGNYPGIPLKFEPGTDFSYAYNHDLAGFVVEKVTGQSLEEYCKEHIFSPLGMETSFLLTDNLSQNAVEMSFRRTDGLIEPWADQIPLIERDPKKLQIAFGGLGLYSSLKDYLSLLRHLLQILDSTSLHPIINAKYVPDLFEATLPPQGMKTLNTWLGETDCQWSNAMCINTTDWPRRRRKGSGFWYGWAGTHFFIDPSSGIAAMLGTQVLPTNDPEVLKLWKDLEEALYAGLVT